MILACLFILRISFCFFQANISNSVILFINQVHTENTCSRCSFERSVECKYPFESSTIITKDINDLHSLFSFAVGFLVCPKLFLMLIFTQALYKVRVIVASSNWNGESSSSSFKTLGHQQQEL
jgi:hypothetical protein